MITIFVHRIGRRQVHFSRHAVERYRERCHPDYTSKQARAQLKRWLSGADVMITSHNPPWVKPSRWSQGLAHDWLILGGAVCFPLNRDLDGRWVAPTCMVDESVLPQPQLGES